MVGESIFFLVLDKLHPYVAICKFREVTEVNEDLKTWYKSHKSVC